MLDEICLQAKRCERGTGASGALAAGAVLPLLQEDAMAASFRKYERLISPALYHNPNGVHGVGHIRRTLLLSLLMARMDNLSEQHTRILAYASVYHDIGRTHDGVDDYHGYASYQKVMTQSLLSHVETSEVSIIKELIERHAINDHQAFSMDSLEEPLKSEVCFLLRYFKDADGLDRVRLGDLKAKYLRTDIARGMPIVAQQLLENGTEFLSKINSKHAAENW